MIKSFNDFDNINESIEYATLVNPGKNNITTNYKTIKGGIAKAIEYLESDKKIK